MNLGALLGLAVIAFVSTNIDDISSSFGFLADTQFRLRNVAIGQYIGAPVVVSVAASLAKATAGVIGEFPTIHSAPT